MMDITNIWKTLDSLMHSKNTDFRIFLLYFFSLLCFLIYWFTIEHLRVSEPSEEQELEQAERDRISVRYFIFNKSWGFLWLGFFGILYSKLLFPQFSLSDFGFTFSNIPATLRWNIILLPLGILGGFLQNRKIARSNGDFGRYPEIGVKNWTAKTLTLHVFFWSLYLVGYEVLFRGILLIIPAYYLGPWTAIGINTALYSAFHISKGQREAVGAVFLGLLLCLVTLRTENIWTAILVHIALAVSNGYFAYRGRRKMA